MPKGMPTTELHELVRKRLAKHDTRYTSGRQSVVASIQMAPGPRTTAELITATEGVVPVSSLYRTLAAFERAGVVKKQHGPDGIAHYELAEWLTGHHHHVVCVACGAIVDVTLPGESERQLHAIVESLGTDAGYRVLDHVLEVEGVCQTCNF